MRKILIISYYWPPSGGSGVQRWLKFSKYLPENNWKPIIYTPENPYSQLKDDGLLDDMPIELEVWKKRIWEPYSLKDKLFGNQINGQSSGIISNKKSLKSKFLNWIRGNLFIPDPKVFWVKSSIKKLQKKIQEEGIEHIITTGPPHSMHLIGLGLKKLLPSIKWIADFRDPWSELDQLDEFHLTKFSKNRHKYLEKKVLSSADIVLTVSETWLQDFKRLGAKRAELITNGYDSSDFSKNIKKNDKFIIGHYGLLNHLRNPKYFWKNLNTICSDNIIFNEKLEIHLAGNIDENVFNEIKSYEFLSNKIKNLGYLSHKDVLDQYNESSVLLLLLFNSKVGVGNYPGKIFEYFAAKKPILAFGPESSDVYRLIQKTNTGIYFSYKDDNLRNGILSLFNNSCNFKPHKLDDFSRVKLTKDLSLLLNSI